MAYLLYHTRLNTDYSRIKKILWPHTSHTNVPESLINKAEAAKFHLDDFQLSELNLESFCVTCKANIETNFHSISIDVMQSLPTTSRCFDLFIRVHHLASNDVSSDINIAEFERLNHFIRNFIGDLSQYFNGKWIIRDQDLSLSILK